MILIKAKGECVLRRCQWSIVGNLDDIESKKREGNNGFDRMEAKKEIDRNRRIFFFYEKHMFFISVKLYR